MAPFFIQKVWQGKGRENRIIAGGHSRIQQRFFQGGGRGPVHVWNTSDFQASLSCRCAVVSDEYNNISICQPSWSPSLTKTSMFTTCAINSVCVVVVSVLPNTCRRSPYARFIPTLPGTSVYCSGFEVRKTWCEYQLYRPV